MSKVGGSIEPRRLGNVCNPQYVTTMKKPAPTSLPSQSLARGLEVFEFIAFSRRAVRLKDVATAFELDMASTHRILKTLEELGYISRLSIGKAYGPGEKLQTLAKSFSAVDRMIELLHPVVVGLADATGLVAHTAIRREDHAVLAEVAVSAEAKVTIRQAPGDADELFCSAIGKSLLANLPSFEQNGLLRSLKFTAHTPHTITSMAALKRELTKVNQEGIAFDDKEGDLQISCIGAPILDQDGFALAAIGVSMLASSIPGSVREEQEKAERVREAAAEATRLVRSKTHELFLHIA